MCWYIKNFIQKCMKFQIYDICILDTTFCYKKEIEDFQTSQQVCNHQMLITKFVILLIPKSCREG